MIKRIKTIASPLSSNIRGLKVSKNFQSPLIEALFAIAFENFFRAKQSRSERMFIVEAHLHH